MSRTTVASLAALSLALSAAAPAGAASIAFSPFTAIGFGTAQPAGPLAAGDFNGDGVDDVAIADSENPNEPIRLFTGDPTEPDGTDVAAGTHAGLEPVTPFLTIVSRGRNGGACAVTVTSRC